MSDFYNTDEKENTAATIFIDDDFDEMQKAENYKIGYKLFKILFSVVSVVPAFMYTLSVSTGEFVSAVMSLILFIFTWVMYVIYAAKASEKGVMNPSFAKSASAEWRIPACIGFIVFCIIFSVCGVLDYKLTIGWGILMTANIFISHYAKRNMKVLEKQLKDGDEE